MLELTRQSVQEHYCRANGYEHDAVVIYGDTDSVMVKFGTSDITEAMRLGLEAATLVSKKFKNPIRLEFEKVYWPYLLLARKRYVGLYWTRPDKWDKIDAKGVESVRRDNCGLVKKLFQECLDTILVKRSPELAVAHVKATISQLLLNKIDLSLLVISKSLGKGASSGDYDAKQVRLYLHTFTHSSHATP
jgi:DNA polymerase delta subunit 1